MRTSPRIMNMVLCCFVVDKVTVEIGAFNEFYIFHSVRYDLNILMVLLGYIITKKK